jgi:hypothetical protein
MSVLVPAAVPLTAIAADDGSLDSMWVDAASKTGSETQSSTTTPAASTPVTTPATNGPAAAGVAGSAAVNSAGGTTASETGSVTGAATAGTAGAADTATTSAAVTAAAGPDINAPMCSLEAFRNSSLVVKGGWPGVGPFKPSSDSRGTEFIDDQENRVKVDVNGDQITRAEMTLANKRGSGSDQKELLDMQMHVDFLLEAVGIKPKRILDFNAQLEKQKDAFLHNNSPLSVVTGRYAVSIERRSDSGQNDYVIAVNSLDANKRVIKEPWAAEAPKEKALPESTGANTTIRMTMDGGKQNEHKPAKTAPKVAAHADSAQLKAQFAELINGWQKVKKAAVRNRQTDDLASVLGGKALTRQTEAVKWLVSNHRYYDMNPKGVVVDQFTEISANKYMVAAQVHEAYKFIDDQSGKVLREVDDVNKVNYTVEKQGNKWVITDSALLSAANSKGATQKH